MNRKERKAHPLVRVGVFALVLVANALPLFSSAFGGPSIQIRLMEESLVRRGEVTLSQIARIEGEDPSWVTRLGEIPIALSPGPGRSMHLSREFILARIQKGIGAHPPWRLQGAERVSIREDSLTVRKEEIGQWVAEEILTTLRWPRDMVRVREISGLRDVVLPKGEITREIQFLQRGGDQGDWAAQVLFRVDGEGKDSLRIRATVDLFRMVVVSARPLDKGTLIGPDDVVLAPLPFQKSTRVYLSSTDQAVGKVLRSPVGLGEPLTAQALESSRLVKVGSIVTLVAEKGPLRITTLGQVKEEGGLGDTVRVMNLSSKKVLYGRVFDSKTVGVDF